MADTKISALTAVTTPATTDEFVVNQGGVSKKVAMSQLISAQQAARGMPYVQALASDATANATTTAAKITGLDYAVPAAGTYIFEYWIRYVSSVATTGVKFSVNHTGTITAFMANMSAVSAAATTAGTMSQVANASTGQAVSGYSARAKSTAAGMGPTLGTDGTGDMLLVVEGLLIATTTGTMELYHASETAASTTVKAGSSLVLTRTA